MQSRAISPVGHRVSLPDSFPRQIHQRGRSPQKTEEVYGFESTIIRAQRVASRRLAADFRFEDSSLTKMPRREIDGSEMERKPAGFRRFQFSISNQIADKWIAHLWIFTNF